MRPAATIWITGKSRTGGLFPPGREISAAAPTYGGKDFSDGVQRSCMQVLSLRPGGTPSGAPFFAWEFDKFRQSSLTCPAGLAGEAGFSTTAAAVRRKCYLHRKEGEARGIFFREAPQMWSAAAGLIGNVRRGAAAGRLSRRRKKSKTFIFRLR